MATGIETLTLALRDIGAIAFDEIPDADDQKLGLAMLVDLLGAIVDGFTPDQLYVQSAAQSLEIGGNVHLRATASPLTVTLPAAPIDGWRVRILNVASGSITVAPNGYLLGATAAAATSGNATVTAGETLDRFFRADLGAWISPTITQLSDPLPYPASYDAGLAAMLAAQIAPKYELSAQVTPIAAALAQATQAQLDRRYGARAA